jgi:hypothetical protein
VPSQTLLFQFSRDLIPVLSTNVWTQYALMSRERAKRVRVCAVVGTMSMKRQLVQRIAATAQVDSNSNDADEVIASELTQHIAVRIIASINQSIVFKSINSIKIHQNQTTYKSDHLHH